MKKTSTILLIVTLLFGAFTYYFMYHADGGADGLSAFIPLVFVGVIFMCLLFAFVLSLFLRKGQGTKTRNVIIGIAIALPALGAIAVVGTFIYFSWDYNNSYNDQVELNKTVLEDERFTNENFGVTFQYVSGRVTMYRGEEAIPTAITPKIENGKLFVPIDDESYHSPNVLMKIDIDSDQSMTSFFEGLKNDLHLESTQFQKSSSGKFIHLETTSQIWQVNLVDIPSEDMSKLLKHFSPREQDYPEVIYYIKSSKTPTKLWVLFVPNTILSAPASVERMTTSNVDNSNLWFHTLEILN